MRLLTRLAISVPPCARDVSAQRKPRGTGKVPEAVMGRSPLALFSYAN